MVLTILRQASDEAQIVPVARFSRGSIIGGGQQDRIRVSGRTLLALVRS